MKRLSLGLLLCSLLQAEWGFDMLEKSAALYDETREKTIQIYKDTLKTFGSQTVTPSEEKAAFRKKAWESVVGELKEGTRYIDRMKRAPEHSWIGEDRSDIQKDLNRLFDRIIKGLVGESMVQDQQKMASCKEEIDANRQMMLHYREKRIGAPQSSTLYTTKSQYDDKIALLKQKNRMLENEMRILKIKLQRRFAEIGVSLSLEQVEVLLTRVDGNDIIRIAMVMDTLKYITLQIQKLMQESGEALKQAKRYYGMHQVLLELVVYIQQQYIDKCNRLYIPKVRKIITQAQQMIDHTKVLKSEEENSKRAMVYAHNIDALKWTMKTARQYEADLAASRDKMKKAQQIALANLRLSQNTYETVSLSSDLYDLISESQEMFMEVSKIQVPDIVPFENSRLKKKYTEITRKIR